MAVLSAQFAGRCTTCGQPFEVGASIFYTDDDALAGWECCGIDEPAAVVPEETARVMPRGKTARDACGLCFQVPASNGMCGCAW